MAETIAIKVDKLIDQMELGVDQTQWRSLLQEVLEAMTWITRFETWTNANALSTTGASTQKDLDGIDSDYMAGGIIKPDYPRNVNATAVISNGDITQLDITFTGTDLKGDEIVEVLTLNADETVTGVKAFFGLTSVSVAVTCTLGGAAGDTLDSGFGVNMGICGNVLSDCIIKANLNRTDSGAGDVVVDEDNNTIVFETAPNGTHDYDIWYLARQ